MLAKDSYLSASIGSCPLEHVHTAAMLSGVLRLRLPCLLPALPSLSGLERRPEREGTVQQPGIPPWRGLWRISSLQLFLLEIGPLTGTEDLEYLVHRGLKKVAGSVFGSLGEVFRIATAMNPNPLSVSRH